MLLLVAGRVETSRRDEGDERTDRTRRALVHTGASVCAAAQSENFDSPSNTDDLIRLVITIHIVKMRQKRSKTYRKLLASYVLHFGYRPPFQLLIDAPFAQSLSALHLSQSEVEKRLSDVLQTSQLTKGKMKAGVPEMKCMITQCCMVELYQAEKEGKTQKDAVTIAKSWERRRCNHREAIPGDQCLKEVIGEWIERAQRDSD